MMKKSSLLVGLLVSLANFAQAKAPAATAKVPSVKNEVMHEQMDNMILSVADMDKMTAKGGDLDYDILKEDAQRILTALQKIKVADRQHQFGSHIANVEKPAQNLLKYANLKDPRAGQYPQEIFEACFKCHADFRRDPYPAPIK
jgi:hypothetical protein